MGRDDDKSRKCRRWGGRKRNGRRLIVQRNGWRRIGDKSQVGRKLKGKTTGGGTWGSATAEGKKDRRPCG
jgi:hypothetical protein